MRLISGKQQQQEHDSDRTTRLRGVSLLVRLWCTFITRHVTFRFECNPFKGVEWPGQVNMDTQTI